ncbi:MAG TPA: hypothetical protein PKV73_16660 [Agriterribacter sp.]|nr:hypothetical protein [Agriterribacter sp.]
MRKESKWENIKLEKAVVDKLRTHKQKTGVSITAFITIAINKELSKLKSKK